MTRETGSKAALRTSDTLPAMSSASRREIAKPRPVPPKAPSHAAVGLRKWMKQQLGLCRGHADTGILNVDQKRMIVAAIAMTSAD